MSDYLPPLKVRDRLRPLTRPLFLSAVVLSAVLVLIQPALLPGVIVGFVLALLCVLLPRGGISTRVRLVASGAATLSVLIAASAALLSGGTRNRAPGVARIVELATTLQIVADYSSKSGSLMTSDTLTIDAGEFTQAVASKLLPSKLRRRLSSLKLESAVTAGLRSQGWKTVRSNRGVTATRAMSSPVRQHTLIPGTTGNTLTIAKPRAVASYLTGTGGAAILPIRFVVLKGSIVLKAPAHMISATDPSSDAKSITRRRESRTIALDPGTDKVDYDVRSKWLRNEALASVTSWTAWSPLKWLLGLLVALANDAVRDWLKGLFRRGKADDAKSD
jgi:hypothetical protein